MGKHLLRLDEIQEADRLRVGEKAYSLALIRRHQGLQVPDGFVLPADVFLQFADQNKFVEALSDFAEGADFVQVHRLQKRIKAGEFPEHIRKEVSDLTAKLARETLAVRSSFTFEDRAGKTFAGIFKSFTDVKPGPDVVTAIKETWASAFNPLTAGNQFPINGIAVLVQSYVKATFSGIAFSRDFKDKEKLVISYGRGGAEGLTQGVAAGGEVRLNREDPTCSDARLMQVALTVRDLDRFFGHPVDVEWAYDGDGTLFILQCRPARIDVAPRTFAIADVDSQMELRGFELGPCTGLHGRWYRKKHFVRAAAQAAGFSISVAKYVRYNPSELKDSDVEALARLFRTTWLTVGNDTTSRKVRRDRLGDSLKSWSRQPTTVRIEEVIPTLISGISSVDAGTGESYTEFVPGGLYGFRNGQVPPSWARIKGQSIQVEVTPCRSYVAFDEETGSWFNKECDPPLIPDPPLTLLLRVDALTRAMQAALGETRPEWIYDGTTLHFFDTSVETAPLRIDPDSRRISPGTVTAPVWKLHNLEAVDRLWDGHVSVWRSDEFYKTQQTIRLRDVLPEYTGDVPPILVCEYPVPQLALLTKHVAGFIFETGSLLCHLAIILREEGVPAVVIPGAMHSFTDGALVSIE